VATVPFEDANGDVVNIEKPLTPGRAAASASKPVVLSTEDRASVTAIEDAAESAASDLTAINGKLPTLVNSSVPVKTLLAAGVARQLTTAATTANQALTNGIKAISIHARNSDARFEIGSTSQTATATSHFIAVGERLEFAVPSTPNIGYIYGPSGSAAVLEISELS